MKKQKKQKQPSVLAVLANQPVVWWAVAMGWAVLHLGILLSHDNGWMLGKWLCAGGAGLALMALIVLYRRPRI